MAPCINWMRIIANGGVSFFTAGIAAIGAGVAEEERIKVALFVALLQGGLAFFLELKKEAEGEGKYNPPIKPSLAVLF